MEDGAHLGEFKRENLMEDLVDLGAPRQTDGVDVVPEALDQLPKVSGQVQHRPGRQGATHPRRRRRMDRS